MRWSDVATIDFETLPIQSRPEFPPPPVGVSIKLGGRKAKYYAWGHPAGNNCSFGEAQKALAEVWDSTRPLLFHNASFDVDVAETHMGMSDVTWSRIYDTMPMLFLDDPRAKNYKLKDSAERLLGEAPDERDAVLGWLIEHQPIPGKKLNDKPKGKNYAGAFVAFCDARIAGPYANGDVDRTLKLAKHVYKSLYQRGMGEALQLERRLFRHVLEMERTGVRVDVELLERDIAKYEKVFAKVDQWLTKRLKLKEEINFNSGRELAYALLAAGVAKEEDFDRTKTGLVATNKASLEGAIGDHQVLATLKYRAQLKTCLGTFMHKWYDTASNAKGLMFTKWNSTHTGDAGARTGRLSSTPNFQNVPKEFQVLFRRRGYPDLPEMPFRLPPLPKVRKYILPYTDDHILIDRDYSQQELRILGHFEDGLLRDAYNANPWLDLHTYAQKMINKMTGKSFARKAIKTTGFGLIYGMGVGKLAAASGITVPEAKEVKDAYLRTFPGLSEMYRIMKKRAREGEPIHTWLGREYYCEEPKLVDGKMRQFDYKLLNVLIQGSAAECTKFATAQYCDAKPKGHMLHLLTHDQLTASVPRDEVERGMQILKDNMESVKFDVPMLSEGKTGENLEDLKPYDQKGRRV